MKKTKIKLYISFLVVFLIVFAIGAISFKLLTEGYINRSMADKFQGMTDRIATDFNLQTNHDFDLFKRDIDSKIEDGKEYTNSELYELVKDDDFGFKYIDSYKMGYIDPIFSNELIRDVDHYYLDDIEYQPVSDYATDYYQNSVTIYSLKVLLANRENPIEYTTDGISVVYRYKNVVLYFDAHEYANKLLLQIVDMGITSEGGARYIIMQKDGNIVLDQNSDEVNKKFYTKFKIESNFLYRYDELVKDNLENGRSGYGIFSVDDSESYLIFSPILSNYGKNPLFITYIFKYAGANQSTNYKRAVSTCTIVLVVIGALLLTAFTLGYVITILRYDAKEHDFSLSRMNYFRIKVFNIYVKKNGRIVAVNKALRKGIDDYKQYRNVNDFKLYDEVFDTVELMKQQKPFSAIFLNPDKKEVYIRFVPVIVGKNFFLLGENVTEATLEQIKNRKYANYNSVTGLPNKIILDKELEELLRGDLHGIYNSLIAIDLLDFAKINKMFGFEAADNLLREIAKRISETSCDFEHAAYNIRTSFFVVLVKNMTEFSNAMDLAKKLMERLQEPLYIKESYLITIEPRIGFYNIDPELEESKTPKSIYDSTLIALDRAKGSKLTHLVLYSPEFAKMLTREQMMENDLADAVKSKEFVMYYQPQFSTKLNRIVGFEALIRWNNPKYIGESPQHWIAIAEKNGMIVPIGDFIIDSVFSFAKSVEKTGIRISMNVSPVQLLQAGFINELIQKFNSYGLERGCVSIEITETFLMENSEVMISKLKLLKDNGFSIHLDDFGMGYSSLLYLKDLPVDVIKIDQEFTKSMTYDKYSRTIISKLTQIAGNLELGIIVEGVENEKQKDMLYRMKAYVIQGFLISKPVSKESVMELVEKYNGSTSVKGTGFDFDDSEDKMFTDLVEGGGKKKKG